jgi:hypothetical protein
MSCSIPATRPSPAIRCGPLPYYTTKWVCGRVPLYTTRRNGVGELECLGFHRGFYTTACGEATGSTILSTIDDVLLLSYPIHWTASSAIIRTTVHCQSRTQIEPIIADQLKFEHLSSRGPGQPFIQVLLLLLSSITHLFPRHASFSESSSLETHASRGAFR